MTLKSAIETIVSVVAKIGPAPARAIEAHPDVVQACRATKTKCRKHLEAMAKAGKIRCDFSAKAPRYWA